MTKQNKAENVATATSAIAALLALFVAFVSSMATEPHYACAFFQFMVAILIMVSGLLRWASDTEVTDQAAQLPSRPANKTKGKHE